MPHHLAAYSLDRASVPLIIHADLQGSQHLLDIFRYLANFLKAPDVLFMQYISQAQRQVLFWGHKTHLPLP